ncbi:MAG: hypothetical protein B7Z55_09120, partial [Planctomycetales bacterium 12-60-4]
MRRDGEQLEVLRNINLDVPERSIVALVGASGCGKSTLLNIIAGLAQPDQGQVLLNDIPSRAFRDWRTMAYMFQEDRLFPWRTTAQNVGLGLEAFGVPRKERRERVRSVLELVGLDKFADSYPHELSGGMRSRAALGRSLVTEPVILLMDEPFSKLDPSIRAQMHEEVLRIAALKGMTVIFVTHDVGQQHKAIWLFDEADRDPRHRLGDRHTRVHQRQRRAAHGGHRAAAVRFRDVGDHANRVRELFFGGNHPLHRAFGQGPVADFPATGSADRTDFANRVRREVVVEHKPLSELRIQPVDTLRIARGSQHNRRQRLGFTACEQ